MNKMLSQKLFLVHSNRYSNGRNTTIEVVLEEDLPFSAPTENASSADDADDFC